MIRLVGFDLDGTLLDSVPDLTAAVNFALKAERLPLKTTEEVRCAVGNGVVLLLKRVAPKAEGEQLQRLRNRFNEYYEAHCCDESILYPGIAELIQKLTDSNIAVAVYSNKPVEFVGRILNQMFPKNPFCSMLGQDVRYREKPDAHQFNELITSLGFTKHECVYVGDSDVDIQTAQNAGIEGIGVSWGYRSREVLENAGAKRIAENVSELDKMLFGG